MNTKPPPLDDIEAEGRDEVVSALKTPTVPSSPLQPRDSLDHGRMGGRKWRSAFTGPDDKKCLKMSVTRAMYKASAYPFEQRARGG